MERRRFLAVAAAIPGGVASGRLAQVQVSRPGANAAWPPALTMGTASPGGTYAVYGPAWGGVVHEATGVSILYRATGGPNENILLLDRDAIDLGMATLGVARQAWDGAGDWTGGARLRSMRALFPMYDTPFHGVTLARSGIAVMAQLAGRRVGVGPENGTAGTYYPVILRLLGIAGVQLFHGSMEAQAAALAAGKLDACLLAAGPPVPAFAVESASPLAFIGFSGAETARLTAALPELTPSVVPGGLYRGLDRDLATLGMFNFAFCRRGLAADLVYQAVRAVMAAPDALRAIAAVGAQTLASNADRDKFLPFHPGAARYYAEQGVPIPDGLVLG